jgi:hypothetical protein
MQFREILHQRKFPAIRLYIRGEGSGPWRMTLKPSFGLELDCPTCTCTVYSRLEARASISFLALETRLQNETSVQTGLAFIYVVLVLCWLLAA